MWSAIAKSCPQAFRTGDGIEVLSDKDGKWHKGKVLHVADKDETYDGYALKAGFLKVEYDSGKKYIQPEQVSTLVRKARDSQK